MKVGMVYNTILYSVLKFSRYHIKDLKGKNKSSQFQNVKTTRLNYIFQIILVQNTIAE